MREKDLWEGRFGLGDESRAEALPQSRIGGREVMKQGFIRGRGEEKHKERGKKRIKRNLHTEHRSEGTPKSKH